MVEKKLVVEGIRKGGSNPKPTPGLRPKIDTSFKPSQVTSGDGDAGSSASSGSSNDS